MRLSRLVTAAPYELKPDQVLEAITLRKKVDLAGVKKLTGAHKVAEVQPVIAALVEQGLLQKHPTSLAGMYIATNAGKQRVLHSFSHDELSVLKQIVLDNANSEAQLIARTKIRGVKDILKNLERRHMIKDIILRSSKRGWMASYLADELAYIAGWRSE